MAPPNMADKADHEEVSIGCPVCGGRDVMLAGTIVQHGTMQTAVTFGRSTTDAVLVPTSPLIVIGYRCEEGHTFAHKLEYSDPSTRLVVVLEDEFPVEWSALRTRGRELWWAA